jgi:DNA primase
MGVVGGAYDFDFGALKRVVSVEHVLASRGRDGSLRRVGRRLVGACPVHGGDNPTAFVVDPERNTWFCFTGCGRGGDVVDLVRLLDGASYRQAGQTLAQLAGEEVPLRASLPIIGARSTPSPFRPFTGRLRLDPRHPFLQRKGIEVRTAEAFEAGAYQPNSGFLAGCIGVRLHDPSGAPLGYAGRHLNAASGSKWKLPPRFPKAQTLYGFHRIDDATGVVVVECPWAVMRLAQVRVAAVALLGIHASRDQLARLRRFSRVLLLLDGDEAGRQATRTLRRALSPNPVFTGSLPEGLDPDDLDDAELLHTVSATAPLASFLL